MDVTANGFTVLLDTGQLLTIHLRTDMGLISIGILLMLLVVLAGVYSMYREVLRWL